MSLNEKQLLSTSIIVLAAITYTVLERFFPYNKGQKIFRPGFWLDFFWYTLVQSLVLGYLIAQLISWMDSQTGFSRLHLITDWPVWQQVLLLLVVHDFYIYCFHRMQHNFPILWRLHEAHHSVEQVDWLAGSRSHPLEILINQTIEFMPIVFLGAAPEVAIYKGAISAVWGMYIHSNLNIHVGWLQYIINGPEAHRWHHAEDRRVYFKNFGTKFGFWDLLFGTYFLPKNEKAQKYGLGYEGFPDGYFKQIAYAFRKLSSPTRSS